jgi:hypothetical protein
LYKTKVKCKKISEEQADVRSLNGKTKSRRNGHARMGELMVSIIRDEELVDRPCGKGRRVTRSGGGKEYPATKGRRTGLVISCVGTAF